MISRSWSMTCLAALFMAATLSAQSVTVSGTVTDRRTGGPLERVLVRVEGQPIFVESDAAGQFTLSLPVGRYTLAISLVGYAFRREPIDIDASRPPAPLQITLSEGAGVLEEHVTVTGRPVDEDSRAPGGMALHGRDFQALRGVTLDDPLRALQAVPSASSTDDFYSEFAIRGLGFEHTGLTVDGIPTRYLMHGVHGVTDGGSIAMINSDAVESLTLLPGSAPGIYGRNLGAEVNIATRQGDRDRFRARAGLSGTSATLLAEGPLGNRASFLVSARRSYLDLLLNRIDQDNNLAFGFSDGEAKITLDLTPAHQLEVLAIAGMSRFDEHGDDLGANDEARVSGRTWLTGLRWRYAPSPKLVMSHRVYATGLAFHNINNTGDALDDRRADDLGWRTDVSIAPRRALTIDLGGDAQFSRSHHDMNRALNDAVVLTPVNSYRADNRAQSAYAQMTFTGVPRLTLTPGMRVDRWRSGETTAASPWANADLRVTETMHLRAAAGRYRQFPDLEQLYGIRGGAPLGPETARDIDAGVTQQLPRSVRLHLNWYARQEDDVIWARDAEPRRSADGRIIPGRGDAPLHNALHGDASGVELVVRRDAPVGIAGWIGYAYGRHDYTDRLTGERFAADQDQRHALSAFARYPLSNRTTIGVKFRYGSNYPRVGYLRAQPASPDAPPLFGGGVPLFFELADERNTLRLPVYARLDLRADRTFSIGRHRLTAFAELANAFNRDNLRNVPYAVDRNGRVFGGTDSLMPILPSAGFVLEF
jgi:hypothetical protein